VESRHFDWWGGWSYGYRHVLDITVFLSLMLIPVFDALRRNVVVRGLFAVALLWSVGVQIIGVTAYDLGGWNNREATIVFKKDRAEPVIVFEKSAVDALRREPGFSQAVETHLDVDNPDYRGRLWSVADSPLVYYVTHFRAARQARLSAL
jgi:hypothetical protein